MKDKKENREHTIKSSNSIEDIVEVRVAHVGVDLGVVTDARGGETEAGDGPLEVSVPVSAADGQTLTDGRLINLYAGNTSSLEVDNLVAESKTDLGAEILRRDIVTDERPLHHGDGTSQHTLHGLRGQRLGVLDLVDGHGTTAGDITKDDRGLDATGTVRDDPTVLSEVVTVEEVTKVLNHVVTLGLTMDEDVKANLLLELNNLLHLGLDESIVVGIGELTLVVLLAGDTDLLGLGERANGGGGEERKLELLDLGVTAGREGRGTLPGLGGDLGNTVTDLGVDGLGRGATGLDSGSIGRECLLHRLRALVNGLGNGGDLRDLLNREREPREELGVGSLDLLLERGRVGRVGKRARGGDEDTVRAEGGDGLLGKGNGVGKVVDPDVTAIDETKREDLVLTDQGQDGVELLGGTDEVEVKGINVILEGVDVVLDATKVGSNEELGTSGGGLKGLVGLLESELDVGIKIEDQDGLIDLDPVGTSGNELLDQLNVEGQNLGEERQGVEGLSTLGGLAEEEERDGTDKHGAGVNTGGLGSLELLNSAGVLERELLVGLELGDDEVVVGVEPLLHLHGGHVDLLGGLGGGLLQTTAHSKVLLKGILDVLVAGGDGTELLGSVENTVVESVLAGGNVLQALLLLQLPVSGLDAEDTLLEVGLSGLARPVGLDKLLELTLSTDVGETEVSSDNHCKDEESWIKKGKERPNCQSFWPFL